MNAYQRRKQGRKLKRFMLNIKKVTEVSVGMAFAMRSYQSAMANAIKALPKNIPPGRYILQLPSLKQYAERLK